MINFIIYEKDKNKENETKNIIYKFFASNNNEFKIYSYEKKEKAKNNNIYILSSNNFKEINKICKIIRTNGDYNSPIIMICNSKNIKLNNYFLILSIINDNKTKNIKLTEAIEKAYEIIINSQTFCFISNRIIHKIPLKDILYIEKENSSNKSIIHTKNTLYETNLSIKDIEKNITCIKFIKVHRSCIVNIDNIIKYDYINNIIYFKNDKTNIIARDKRNIIKDKLINKK